MQRWSSIKLEMPCNGDAASARTQYFPANFVLNPFGYLKWPSPGAIDRRLNSSSTVSSCYGQPEFRPDLPYKPQLARHRKEHRPCPPPPQRPMFATARVDRSG